MFNPFTTRDLIDSHCHLTSPQIVADFSKIVDEAVTAGVTKVIDVAVDIKTALQTLEHHKKKPQVVFPTIGLHPETFVPGSDLYNPDWNEQKIYEEMEKIDQMLEKHKEFVMIGECGIDLYWLRKNKVDGDVFKKSKKLQMDCFAAHVELAAKYNLPLTIHAREAYSECLQVLAKSKREVKAIFHSFTEDYTLAKKILDQGYKIGVNGIITYSSAKNLRETVQKIIGEKKIVYPHDLYKLGIFLETDSPYLKPASIKDVWNTPQHISFLQNYLKDYSY